MGCQNLRVAPSRCRLFWMSAEVLCLQEPGLGPPPTTTLWCPHQGRAVCTKATVGNKEGSVWSPGVSLKLFVVFVFQGGRCLLLGSKLSCGLGGTEGWEVGSWERVVHTSYQGNFMSSLAWKQRTTSGSFISMKSETDQPDEVLLDKVFLAWWQRME